MSTETRLAITRLVKKWADTPTYYKKRALAGVTQIDAAVIERMKGALDAAPPDLAPLAQKVRAWIADDARFTDGHDEETQRVARDVFGQTGALDFTAEWFRAFGLARTIRLRLAPPIVALAGHHPHPVVVRAEAKGVEPYLEAFALTELLPLAEDLPSSEIEAVRLAFRDEAASAHPANQLVYARLFRDQAALDDLARRAGDDPAFASQVNAALNWAARTLIGLSHDADAVEKLATGDVNRLLYGGANELARALHNVPVDTMKRVVMTMLPQMEKRAKGGDFKSFIMIAACIDDAEIAEIIARRAHLKNLTAVAHDYFERLPHHLSVLEAAASQKGKVGETAATLVDAIKRKRGEAETRAPVAKSADSTVMPDVLVSPPWQSKDAKADVVRDLAVPDGPATHLRPGEYAKWVQSWHMAELRTVEALRAFVESGKPMYQHEQFLEGLMSVLGAESVTLVVTLAARQPARNVELLMHVVSPRAMVALAPMLSKTSEAPRVRSHLVAHADVAARGLVPAAVSADAKLRSAARLALRVLATNGKSAVVETVAKELGVPMEELERKTALPLPGKLPEFANAAALPAPIVAKTNAPLPLAAVQNLLAILSVLPKDAPHAIAFDIKAACTAESLDAFVWTLVSDYVLAGANARHDWAVFAAGHLGSDAVARKIDAAARGWTQKKVELMQKSLDVLALIGTDVALSLLYQRGLEAKFEDTQLRARQILEQVAAQRGIAYDELEDRLVPELGLDEGPLVLDYGPRSFEVKLDEQLTPFVVIEGARKEKPPKPVKTDDAAKAKAALERFTTLSDDLSHVARTQLLRLERAMREAREWDASQWSREVVRQPLLRHVATRLVWQVGPKLVRVADDGSLADEADAPYVLSDGQRVRIAHPLDAPKDAWGRMGRVFADYAILQPFAQLGRETFDASREIVGGAKAAWSAVDDLLTGRGWIRTPPENGTVRVLSFPLERFGSPGAFASLQITPGLTIGRVKARPEQTVEKLSLTNATFDALHPRVASEIIRDVVTLSR